MGQQLPRRSRVTGEDIVNLLGQAKKKKGISDSQAFSKLCGQGL
jgi:hypothetical protein